MTATIAPGRIRVRALLSALAVVPLPRHAFAVHAVPDDLPWRTACQCGNPPWPNAIGPSGRCGGCGVPVAAAPYAVEAATFLGAAGLAVSGLGGVALAAYAWWTATMTVLAFVDLAVMWSDHPAPPRTDRPGHRCRSARFSSPPPTSSPSGPKALQRHRTMGEGNWS